MKNKRKLDDSISILKFLGIVAVVFGHIGFNVSGHGSRLHTIIYFYHMPLFFFISGYLYKSYTIKYTIIKNIKGLYFPFILWSIIFISMRDIFINLGFYNNVEFNNLHELMSLNTIIDVVTFRYSEPLLGAMWFIPCLFIVRILYALIDKLIDNIKFFSDSKDIVLPFIIVILFIIGINLGITGQFLKYQFDVAFVAILFYYLGVQYKKNKEHISIKFTIALPLILLIWQNIKFGFIDMNNRSYVNVAFFLFNSLSGIYINLALIKTITWFKNTRIKKLVCTVGESTFWILALHFTVFKIITLIKINIDSLPMNILEYIFPGDITSLSWGWIVIYLFLGVIVPVIIKKITINIKKVFIKKVFNYNQNINVKNENA